MKFEKRKFHDIAMGLMLLALVSGACKKKTPPPAPPAPPQSAAAPTVTLTANPATIQRGQTTTLRWTSQNATDLNITPGIGPVEAQGSRSVSPADSTAYTLAVRGPGGTAQATARVTITAAPAPPPPPSAAPPPTAPLGLRERFNREVKDSFFDFDKADLRPDARENLTRSADFLRQNPSVTFSIEGHCDERGSAAYNLGLGDRRAVATKDFLLSLGISAERMKTISYGKEKPFCDEHDESCWQQNRRGHLVCDNCGQ